MTTSIFFDPWVGSHYGTDTSVFRKRILILGASHYCESCDDCGNREIHSDCVDLTKNVVKDYLDPKHQAPWKKTFTSFVNSMLGKSSTISERVEFFNSVAFYNYLQISAGEDPYSTNNYDYTDPKYLRAFYEVLDLVQPDFVICWGGDVWNALPNNWNNNGEAKEGIEISVGEKKFNKYLVYPYERSNVALIGVHHPSIGYGIDYHYGVFSKLIFQN